MRQSQVSITTGCMRGVCVREGGEKGAWGRRAMRDKRIFSGLPQRGRAGDEGEDEGGWRDFLTNDAWI